MPRRIRQPSDNPAPEEPWQGRRSRTGTLAATGRFVLFADADGATPIEEESRLRSLVESGADLAVGSRRIAGDVVCQRHAIRRLVGAAFAQLAQAALRVSVSDPQCGFKMFRREVAQELFSRSREDGYYFDLELLILAERLGYRAAEAPIQWSNGWKPDELFHCTGGMWGAFRRLRGCGGWSVRGRISRVDRKIDESRGHPRWKSAAKRLS